MVDGRKMKILLLLFFLVVSSCSDRFISESHFDLYHVDNGLMFNYIQPKKISEKYIAKRNINSWLKLYKSCEESQILNEYETLNYYVVNGTCIR